MSVPARPVFPTASVVQDALAQILPALDPLERKKRKLASAQIEHELKLLPQKQKLLEQMYARGGMGSQFKFNSKGEPIPVSGKEQIQTQNSQLIQHGIKYRNELAKRKLKAVRDEDSVFDWMAKQSGVQSAPVSFDSLEIPQDEDELLNMTWPELDE